LAEFVLAARGGLPFRRTHRSPRSGHPERPSTDGTGNPVTRAGHRLTATPKKRRKLFILDLYGTAVGKKYAMAITGLMMVGFVVVHMIGNLKMYLGAEDLNHYGEFLRELLVPILPRTVVLWLLRLGLLAAVFCTSTPRTQPHPPEPQGPLGQVPEPPRLPGGQLRQPHHALDGHHRLPLRHLAPGRPHVGLRQQPVCPATTASSYAATPTATSSAASSACPVAVLYIVANIALGTHLFHGAWSLFQSMGWNNPRFKKWRKNIATGVATIVVVGNVSFPIAVLAGDRREVTDMTDSLLQSKIPPAPSPTSGTTTRPT
jgi:succinate dehydrogenase / fumarate reductase cytochrome b subunit